MKNTIKRIVCFALILVLVLALSGMAYADNKDSSKVVKIAFTDPPTLTIGGTTINHPSYAAMLAFKGAFETLTGGEYTVELYPNGVLGDASENLQNLLSGTLTIATPADGTLSSFCNDISVFTVPYLFDSALQAYDILDSDFGTQLWNRLADETGLRVIGSWDNGGYRNFSNSVRTVKSADDMKGLKIRVQESEVYMTLVEKLGATVTPMAFMELYSGLQSGVVDGEENSAITILGASLQEVQPYYTLDNHLLGLCFFTMDNNWYNSLDPQTQEYVLQAGRCAQIAARGITRQAENLAIDTLTESGVEVYIPTPEEKQTFKDATQDAVIEFLRGTLDDPALLDQLLDMVASGEYGTGITPSAKVVEVAVEGAAPAPAAAAAAAPAPAPAPAQSNNTLTVVFGVIAVVAVLLAVFAFTRKPKKEE